MVAENIKGISKALGHSRTTITDEVYIYHELKINDTTLIMNKFYKELNIEDLEFKRNYVYDVSNEIDMFYNNNIKV